MKPRERIGQVSIASEAPAGHSAPMPRPSNARNRNRNQNAGENPAMKLHTEYQAIDSISGFLRPMRSASQPLAVAPISRIHKVTVKTNVTSVSGTWNACEIGSMINRKIVKSKASRVQPSQAAANAYHWSLVGSFHHGTRRPTSAAVAMSNLPFAAAPCWEPCCRLYTAPAALPGDFLITH